jgi:transposase
MNEFTLSGSERSYLEFFVLHAPLGQESCRAQALLWCDEGEPVQEIAERLQVSRQTVYNWIDRFEQRGDADFDARLRDADRSGRPPSALGIIDPILDALIDQDPHSYGYSANVWTAGLLQQHLRQRHGIEVSRKSVSRALDRLRVRWKRPRHVLSRRPHTWRQAKGG